MQSTEQGTKTRQRDEASRQPAYVVRAPDPNKGGHWITLGYAWKRKNGQDGFSIKLNSIPVGNWDGALVLLPPYEDTAEESGTAS